MVYKVRTALVALVVSVVVIIAASAQEVTVTSKMKSSYLGVNGGVFYDGPVLQPDVYVTWSNGIYLDVWASTAFNREREFDKEIDLTLGLNGTMAEVDYTIEANYFILIVPDIFNLNLEWRKTFPIEQKVAIIPYLRLEGYIPVIASGPRRGMMAIVGVRCPVQITPWLSSSFKAQIRKDTGCFGSDPAILAQGSLDFDAKLNDEFRLLVGVNYSDPLTAVSVSDGRKASTAWSGGFSYTF